MNVLEKLAELTTKTGDLTDELLKFRASRTFQESFQFSFAVRELEVQIPFRLTLARPIFIGIRNLFIKRNPGSSGGAQYIRITYSTGADQVSFNLNSTGGIGLQGVIDLSQFSTYIFPTESEIGQDIVFSLFIQHELTTSSFSLLSQGDSSLFVTYI